MTIFERKTHQTSRPRPWRLTILLTLMAVVEAVAAFRALTLPADLTVSLVRPLEVAGGAGWAAMFAWWAVLVWRSSSHSRRNLNTIRAVVVLFTLFAIYSTGRLALFARADYDRQRLPVLIAVTVVGAAAAAVFSGAYHYLRGKRG